MPRYNSREQVRIPTDTTPSDWVNMVVCVPNDSEWLATIRGAMSTLTRGRFWARDARSTSIIDAQATANLIQDSIMICDLTTALNGIQQAINNQSTKNIINACCDAGNQPVDTPPVTTVDFVTPPAIVPEHLPPTTPELMCHWLNYLYGNYLAFINKIEFSANAGFGVAVVVGLLGIVFPEPITTALGTFTLYAVATGLMGLTGGLDQLGDMFADFRLWIEDNFNSIYCAIPAGEAVDMGLALFDSFGLNLASRLVAIGYPSSLADFISRAFVSRNFINALFNNWWQSVSLENYPDMPLSCSCAALTTWVDLAVPLPAGWLETDVIIYYMDNSDITTTGLNFCADYNWCFGQDAVAGGGSNSGRIEFSGLDISEGIWRVQIEYMRYSTISDNPPTLTVYREDTNGVMVFAQTATATPSRDGIQHVYLFPFEFSSQTYTYRIEVVLQGYILGSCTLERQS